MLRLHNLQTLWPRQVEMEMSWLLKITILELSQADEIRVVTAMRLKRCSCKLPHNSLGSNSVLP